MMGRERRMGRIQNARLERRGYLSWTDECTASDLAVESFCDVVQDVEDMLILAFQSF